MIGYGMLDRFCTPLTRAKAMTPSLGLVFCACFVVGCGGDAFSPEPGPWDEAAEIPLPETPPGDVAAGFEALVTRGYVSCGIPFELFTLGSGFLGDLADGPRLVDGDGNPLRTGKGADVPYNWNVFTNDDGVDIASLNCLQCHAGEVNGELVLGVGNVVQCHDRYLPLSHAPQLAPTIGSDHQPLRRHRIDRCGALGS